MSGAATADAFGVDPHAEVFEDQDAPHGDRTAPVGEPASKRGGLPMVAIVGIGVFVVIMVAIIVTAVAMHMKRKNAAAAADQEQRVAMAQQTAEATESSTLRAEINAIRLSLQAIETQQKTLREQIDMARGAQDAGASQRLAAVEQSVRTLQSDVRTVARRAADARPLESDMFRRDDVAIVSIGNGVARVIDTNGQEITLQRGNAFKGLIVREIRADRRQIILSDGSVIL